MTGCYVSPKDNSDRGSFLVRRDNSSTLLLSAGLLLLKPPPPPCCPLQGWSSARYRQGSASGLPAQPRWPPAARTLPVSPSPPPPSQPQFYFYPSSLTPRDRNLEEFGPSPSSPVLGPCCSLSAVASVVAGPARGGGILLPLPGVWGPPSWSRTLCGVLIHEEGQDQPQTHLQAALTKSDIPVFWKIWCHFPIRPALWGGTIRSPLQPPPSHHLLTCARAIMNRELWGGGTAACCRCIHLSLGPSSGWELQAHPHFPPHPHLPYWCIKALGKGRDEYPAGLPQGSLPLQVKGSLIHSTNTY